jgi:hypothetical protein
VKLSSWDSIITIGVRPSYWWKPIHLVPNIYQGRLHCVLMNICAFSFSTKLGLICKASASVYDTDLRTTFLKQAKDTIRGVKGVPCFHSNE